MRKYAILCVDDERSVLDSLALTFKRKYAVAVAGSGAEALDKLRQLPETMVIISDMRMPEMDGARFLAASRQIVPDARRILLTGDRDPTAAITAVNTAGIFRFLSKPCPTDDIQTAVEAAVADYELEMQERSSIRHMAVREALKQDPVTRLESRESFLEHWDEYAEKIGAQPSPGSLLLLLHIDITNDISERENSEATKHGLVVLATRLRDSLPLAECLGRYEPNVFSALLRLREDSDTAIGTLAKDLVDSLEHPVTFNGAGFEYRIRIGVTRITERTAGTRTALREAELALSEAKTHARTAFSIYSPALGERYERSRHTTQALKEAVAREQLNLHYQPIIDVPLGEVYALEALARWEDPTLGRVSPETFIPLAERLGLMSTLTEWALKRACLDARATLSALTHRVSVNVSVAQLMDERFFGSLIGALETSGLTGASLELEVTESVFADDIKTVCKILTAVRDLGVRISIDDFGTGYSSLAYLSQLPVDALKVDRAFVRDFNRGGDAIIGAALDMASKLQLDVIIEGVETPASLGRVCRLGATKIQGYLFAQPMPLDKVRPWHDSFLEAFPSVRSFSLEQPE